MSKSGFCKTGSLKGWIDLLASSEKESHFRGGASTFILKKNTEDGIFPLDSSTPMNHAQLRQGTCIKKVHAQLFKQ